MHARPTPERHSRGRIALIEREIEIYPHLYDLDPAVEMHGEEVRLRAVRLPEVIWRGGEEGVDAAGGFGGADLPGGEGGNFAEVGGEGRVLGCGGCGG